jgi:hypothetical protein
VEKLVFDRFKALCKVEKSMVGEVVQRLMKMCLEVGSVLRF